MASNFLASSLLHPLPVYLFQIILVSSILAFTSPSSPTRLAALPLQVTCVAVVISVALDRTDRIFEASYFAGSGIICLLQYIDTTLLSRWSFQTGSIATKSTTDSGSSSSKGNVPSRGSIWDRLLFGYRTIFSYRSIGTSAEVKDVPPCSTTDPQYVPSRAQFLLHKIAIFLVCYTILDLATSGPPQPAVNAICFLFLKSMVISSAE